jgi:hypothetical protein
MRLSLDTTNKIIKVDGPVGEITMGIIKKLLPMHWQEFEIKEKQDIQWLDKSVSIYDFLRHCHYPWYGDCNKNSDELIDGTYCVEI